MGCIVVFDDIDCDGCMDKGLVFFDELVMLRVIVVISLGIFIVEFFYFWFCVDEDVDDVCDEKVYVVDYVDLDFDKVEYIENGFLWGFDNWIYFVKSDC